MRELQFKTDIKCGGCVAKVTPFLNAIPGVEKWEVDTQNPNKILTLRTDAGEPEQIKKAVREAGFKAEQI
ncbi:MAG: heavy-metal-associated domain-containing protein [Adhaeribacter sp.]